MMDKNTNEVYSIESNMKNSSNNGEVVIPIYGSSYLQSSVVDIPDDDDDYDDYFIEPVPLSLDPDIVMPRIISYYKWRRVRGLLIVAFLGLLLLAASAFLFLAGTQDGIDVDSKIKRLLSGVLMVFMGVIVLTDVLNLCFGIIGGFIWMKKVKKIIKLSGTTWHCQLNSLKFVVPGSMINPCIYQNYNRLLKRSHGYIVVSEEGLVIDEFVAYRYQYRTKVVVRADIVNNPTEKGWVIRVFFAIGGELKDAFRTREYKLSSVDLYMPSSMGINEVIEIYQIILSTSRVFLLQSEFLSNPPVKKNPCHTMHEHFVLYPEIQ